MSRESSAPVHVPRFDRDVLITREEYERAAAVLLARTVDTAAAILRQTGVPPADFAGCFLVGGATRTPLVATLVHRALGTPPIVIEEPQLVVAAGAAHIPADNPAPPAPAPAPPTPPVPTVPVVPDSHEPDLSERAASPPGPRTPPPLPRRTALLWVAAIVALIVAVTAVALANRDGAAGDPQALETPSQHTTTGPEATSPVEYCHRGNWTDRLKALDTVVTGGSENVSHVYPPQTRETAVFGCQWRYPYAIPPARVDVTVARYATAAEAQSSFGSAVPATPGSTKEYDVKTISGCGARTLLWARHDAADTQQYTTLGVTCLDHDRTLSLLLQPIDPQSTLFLSPPELEKAFDALLTAATNALAVR
ncbi:Hsp70 family protein [Dactylosporangium matsuzakiense]|uniref:Hsp70 family protein n=1 Tax=Dactylosporangium matsuzakiense TaxID=53360 RepID=UPI0021C45836